MLSNKGAILVLIWSFLCFIVYHYFTLTDSRDPAQTNFKINSAELLGTCLLLPIGGWLADAYLGRYRAICYGMWTMWLGAMLNGFSLLIGKVVEPYGSYGDPWVTFMSKLIMGAGLAMFQANIIQFGIDQLIDASSTEIKTFILWYIAANLSCGLVLYFSTFCAPRFVMLLVVALSLTLAVASKFLLNHWLLKEQVTSNPLPLIMKIVYFTLKIKLQKRKIVDTEHGFLSKLNFAKKVYNGPFTSEQVEDVKTFFRVILVICIFSVFSGGFPTINIASNLLMEHYTNWINESSNHESKYCYQNLLVYRSSFTFALLVVLVYLMLINPFFHKFIPKVSIMNEFLISLFIFFVGVVALLGIESASYIYQAQLNQTVIIDKCIFHSKYNIAHIDFHWILIPKLLSGLSLLLFLISSIEFICAQAPFSMKGLVLGLTLAFYGLSNLIQVGISSPFIHYHIWQNVPLSCGLWYFMMQGLIALVGLVVVIVIVKTYKKRTRTNITSHSDWQESDSYSE